MAKQINLKEVIFSSNTRREYPLVDRAEPNLFRDLFPYTEVCRVRFDNHLVLIDPPEEIFITDTTFRDGQQARPPYTVDQIVTLFKFLHRLGGPNGVIRQSEFFLYSEKDRKAVEKCLELGYRYPEVTGWIRANPKDFQLVKEMGLKETGILTSVSDYHIFMKLGKSRKQAMEDYLRIVEAALEAGIKPRCHFEDVTRADIYGFCIPFAQRLMKLCEGSPIKVKIRLCDTMGVGVPYPQAILPRSVPKLVRAFIEEAGVPSEELEWHGHNDFYKAVVNATTAWLYGCAAVNCTLLGFGERTGNSPLEAMIMEYISLMGDTNGVDTLVITEIRNYFEKELGFQIPPNMPFVGADFNTTSAGIHIDGLLKNKEIYTIFDTEKILGRPIGVQVTDKSGLAGIVHWINSHFALTGDRKIDKNHPGVAKIHKWVMKQYEAGRVTAISPKELEKQVKKYIPEVFVSEYDMIKKHAKKLASEILKKLLNHPDIASLDPKRAEPVLRKAVEEEPFIKFAYIVNLDGKKITKNITQPADRGKYTEKETDIDYSSRSWFVEPIRTGKIYVSEPHTSRITGNLIITVSGPIKNKDGEIVGVLGLDMNFEDLARLDEESLEEREYDKKVEKED